MADIYAVHKDAKHIILNLPDVADRVGEISSVHEFYAGHCIATVKRIASGWELLNIGRRQRARTLEALLDHYHEEQRRAYLERHAEDLERKIEHDQRDLAEVRKTLAKMGKRRRETKREA